MDLTEALVEIWRLHGPGHITYSNVAKHSGRSRGAVQNKFPSAAAMMKAAADGVMAEGGAIKMKQVLSVQAPLESIALIEAACWIARDGIGADGNE